jgi:hypothetical protein
MIGTFNTASGYSASGLGGERVEWLTNFNA